MDPSHLSVLYEDNHLLVVNKPAELPTMGVAAGNPSLLSTAKLYIKEKYDKPGNVFLGIVSRLDAPVTGVVLMAKTSKAASRLSDQLRRNQVEKVYWALLENPPRPLTGTVASVRRRASQAPVMKKGSREGTPLSFGAPGEIRTPDRLVRSQVLYPAELRAHCLNSGGERGIRTLEGLLTLTPLAGERFRPLSHLSNVVPRARTAHGTGTENAGKAVSAAFCLFGCRGFARGLFALNPLVNFLAVHSHILGCVDPYSDLVSLNPQDGDRNVAPDHDRLTSASRQNQHDFLLLPGGAPDPVLGTRGFS